MGHDEFVFLLIGLKWTVVLSAVGFVCGGIAGLGVALARASGIPLLARVTATYIAVFQGTSLPVQLFVV
ncbi:ABC transporter permease subunit, partial [Rhizobium ruizarguesonis]